MLIEEADFDAAKHELFEQEISGDGTGEALPEVAKRAYTRKAKE